jgi:hypothetical protein
VQRDTPVPAEAIPAVPAVGAIPAVAEAEAIPAAVATLAVPAAVATLAVPATEAIPAVVHSKEDARTVAIIAAAGHLSDSTEPRIIRMVRAIMPTQGTAIRRDTMISLAIGFPIPAVPPTKG